MSRTAQDEAALKVTASTVLQVSRGKVFLGEIVLDEHDRVRRADHEIPRDVVLKALVEYVRGEGWSGTIRGRDGKRYGWRLVSWSAE
jgi:hypothetical protein